jgi:hypothetical protein
MNACKALLDRLVDVDVPGRHAAPEDEIALS